MNNKLIAQKCANAIHQLDLALLEMNPTHEEMALRQARHTIWRIMDRRGYEFSDLEGPFVRKKKGTP